jgi:hypothetical protein
MKSTPLPRRLQAGLMCVQLAAGLTVRASAELPQDMASFLKTRGQRGSTFLERAIAKGKIDPNDFMWDKPELTPAEVRWILESQEAFKLWTGESWCADADRRRQALGRGGQFPGATDAGLCRLMADDMNARDARIVVRIRAGTLDKKTLDNAYSALRGLNPVHFLAEKLVVVATGREPVMGDTQTRIGALGDALLYLLFLKGAAWVQEEMAAVRSLRRWEPPATIEGRVFPKNLIQARDHFIADPPQITENFKTNGVFGGHNKSEFTSFLQSKKCGVIVDESPPMGGFLEKKGFSLIRYKIFRRRNDGTFTPEFVGSGEGKIFEKTVFDPAKATPFDVEQIMLDMYDSIYVSLVGGEKPQTLRTTLSLDGSHWEARAAGGRLTTFYNVEVGNN